MACLNANTQWSLRLSSRFYARLATICIQFRTGKRASRISPSLSLVSVTTPVSTVLFEAGSGNCNPGCGTVVDRGVTKARNWDFFLQSHKGVQGTTRPAYYYVVLDEIFAKRKIPPQFQHVADVLKDLTLSMCYQFSRATKSVSVCPPAYYADIVCERARCYLSGIFDMAISSGTSAPSEAAGGGHPEARTEDVLIHPNLRNTMFYI